MSANVAKAREGSLAHTKWLFGLVEQARVGKGQAKEKSGDGLAELLLSALESDVRQE